MSSIKDRALMIMRSLSARTHLFTLSVLTCTLFLCVGFFYEPNTDFFRTTTSVTKEMNQVASSDLQIDFDVKTLVKDGESQKGVVADSNSDDVMTSYEEYEALCKLVQAEANSEDLTGRTMVANVVLNRVESPHFDNDILSVIKDPGQFDPVSRGAINFTTPTHETKEAVMIAFSEIDLTDGALYFQKSASKEWGNKEYLYRYGAHSFYR